MLRVFFKIVITSVLCLMYIISSSQNKSDDIIGVWLTPENRSAIKIFKQANSYCGKIVWQKEANDKDGIPLKDVNNPNPKLRKNTLEGLIIMRDLCFDGKKEWLKGSIYNPESGNTYKIKVELVNKSTLKVRGYIGFSFIGKTSVWKRR